MPGRRLSLQPEHLPVDLRDGCGVVDVVDGQGRDHGVEGTAKARIFERTL
jgi:hypothetical protein